ncbi:MAG: beta-galactosidase [Bryobacterales bacterium]|nr:beta-galactosidase [Bryobacterales bacterium]
MKLLWISLAVPLIAADLVLPEAVERHGSISVIYKANRLTTGKGTLAVKWTDVHGRAVEDWSRPVELTDENEIHFTLEAARARGMKNTVEAKLSIAGREETAKREFIATPPNTDWWDYVIIMWNHYPARDVATLKTMGISAGQFVGRNTPAPQFLVDNDLRWYAENIATDFYAAYHRYFGDRRVNWLFYDAKARYEKDPTSLEPFKRTPSLSDPRWLETIAKRMETAVRMHKPWGPVFYDLGDESGVADLSAYWDFDFSDQSLAEMRVWLRQRYGTLAALNSQWGSSFKQWDHVIPDTTNQAMKRGDGNWSSWSDFKEWMDVAFARALKIGVEGAHRADPKAFVGIAGAQMPGWGGYDYARLTDAMTMMEPYDIGNNIEIIRSLKPKMPVVTTAFAKGPWEKHRVWYELLHGNSGIIIWDDKNEFITKSGDIAPRGAEQAPYYRELRGGIASQLMNSVRQSDRIAIHYSQPSLRTEWMKQHQPKGEAWLKRNASTERMDSDFLRLRESWCRVIEDLGLQYDFVSYLGLEQGVLARGAYQVLVLPASSSLSEKEAAEIRAFADRGGVVLTESEPGVYDEHSRKLDTPRLAGVKTTRIDPAILNYHQLRLINKESALREGVRKALGIAPAIKVTDMAGAPVIGVETHTFRNGGVTLVALHSNPQLRVNELGPPEFKSNERFEKTQQLRVTLPREFAAVDVRSGKAMGRVRQYKVTLDPYEPDVVALYPQDVPKVEVGTPTTATRGGRFDVTLRVNGGGARHVAHVDVAGPDGKVVAHYSGNVLAVGGIATHAVPLAANDAAGVWKVTVRDVLTGQVVTKTVEVK